LSTAFCLLLVCIFVASGAAIHDELAAQSLIAAVAALAMAFAGISARAADVSFAYQITRRLRPAAAALAIWMVIQLVPISFGTHSIWNYANEALNRQGSGHISVDLGETALALVFYLANVSLILVAVFVAQDRRRAELILISLTAITAATVAVLLLGKLGLIAMREDAGVLAAISALGILLSLANGMRAIERNKSGRAGVAAPAPNAGPALAASGVGLLVCIGGLSLGATLNVALTTLFGVATFGSIQLIRRADFTTWMVGILVATMVAGAAMIVLWRYDPAHAVSPFLQFASASPDAISVAQRLLSDTAWSGTGAGTYAALLPIYQDLGRIVSEPPSTTSAFAIGLGWPMTLFAIAIAIAIVVILYRGALSRGRDSFYPAVGAACAVVVLAQAFCDASLLNSCVAVFSSTIVGLGLAQHIGRRR
jgi:hypothetical protein